LEIDLSFLNLDSYEARIYQDGINADRMAGDFQRIARTAAKKEKLKITLAAGGGFVARLTGK